MQNYSCWQKDTSTYDWYYQPEPVCWQITYGVLVVISQLFGMLIPIIYLNSKKCRHHPASIILILCILEMVSTYQIFVQRAILTDSLDWFYDLQMVYTFSSEDQDGLLYDVAFRNLLIYVTCIIAELCYFIVLSVDLIVTVKRPFKNSSGRISIYHSVALSSTIFIAFTIIFNICNCYWEMDRIYDQEYDEVITDEEAYALAKVQQRKIKEIYTYTIFCLICVFIVVAIISLYHGFVNLLKMKKLNSKSQEIKKKYIINHMLMIGAVIFIWAPLNMIELTMIVFKPRSFLKYLIHGDPFLCVFLTSPIIFALIRMREPYFYFRIKYFFRSMIGKISSLDKYMIKTMENLDDINQDEWLMPLSQLFQNHQNNESIAHILVSILKVVDYNQKNNFDITLDELKRQAKLINTAEITERNKKGSVEQINDSDLDTEVPFLENNLNNLSDYKINEYAPNIFLRLRQLDGLTEDKFRQSLDLVLNKNQIIRSQESLGKSGSFFFFSHDRRLILKTLKYEELQTLLNTLLSPYFLYLSQNKQTLIAKMYGAYTVNIGNLSSVHLILMEDTTNYIPLYNCRIYDIKGSIVGRYVNQINLADNFVNNDAQMDSRSSSMLTQAMMSQILPEPGSPIEVLKDVNFVGSDDLFLELDSQIRKELFKVLQADSNLLKSLNIMDYSLFLCIANLKEGDFIEGDQNNQFRSIIYNGQIISMSVIDILQRFNTNKWIENQFKSLNSGEANMISTIDAGRYSQRFLTFINSFCLPAKQYPL